MKEKICTLVGVAGGWIAGLFGGFDAVGQGCTVQFRDGASYIELGAEL